MRRSAGSSLSAAPEQVIEYGLPATWELAVAVVEQLGAVLGELARVVAESPLTKPL